MKLRAQKKHFSGIFICLFWISIEVFAGFLAACQNNFVEVNFSFNLVLVLIAYAFFGEFANILYWPKETFARKEKYRLTKKHYEFLCNKTNGRLFLDGKGKIFDAWIRNFVLAIFLCLWQFF